MTNFDHYPEFNFNIHQKSTKSLARLGTYKTPHGAFETPAFIFCGTKANVKATLPRDLVEHKTQIILSNTYHLMIQPGADTVEKMGGLHKFMGWNGPTFTDSGGYQVFSMGHGSVSSEIKGNRQQKGQQSLLKITEEGALFRSYLDGKKILLTPEKSIEIQKKLGADLIVAFDECTAYRDDKEYTKMSMHRTHRWAKRSWQAFLRHYTGKQALYGVIQGGVFPELRKESTDFIKSQPFFAHAVGGCLGAQKSQMYDVVSWVMEDLKAESKPVHLLGIGDVRDIWFGVSQGIDTFDCVSPTRIARHGNVYKFLYNSQNEYSTYEKINLRNSRFREVSDPIDPHCHCYTCKNFSSAYLHHLIYSGEILGAQLLTLHNIYFMNELMRFIRQSIQDQTFETKMHQWLKP